MKVITRVWDVPLRLFHWLLVVAVVAAYVTATLGGNLMDWHGRIGSFILGLLVFRVCWGFLGTTHARFASFFPSVSRLRAYFKGRWQGVGHNPLGALSVFALLADLIALVGSGLFASDDIAYAGPFFILLNEDSIKDRVSGLHEQSFNVLLLLLALHLASIVYYRCIKKTNLITPMLTGNKVVPKSLATTVTGGSVFRLWIAVFISGGVVWLVWNVTPMIMPVSSPVAPITVPSF